MPMDKKIVGLVGAISGLMSLSTAQATAVPPTETALPSAHSFGELLDPIPNAAALLRIADAAGRHTNPNVKLVHDNHHHHHHHHHKAAELCVSEESRDGLRIRKYRGSPDSTPPTAEDEGDPSHH